MICPMCKEYIEWTKGNHFRQVSIDDKLIRICQDCYKKVKNGN